MLQVFVAIIVLAIFFGGFLAITLSRKEGREFKKSCSCSLPVDGSEQGSSCGCPVN